MLSPEYFLTCWGEILIVLLSLAAMHTSNSKSKGNCQQNDQIKNAENASYVPSQRANGRSISLSAPMAGRSQNLTYAKIGVAKESKMNLSTGEHLPS